MAYYSNINKYESLGCIDNPPWQLAETNNLNNNNNRTYAGFADDNTYNTSAMDNSAIIHNNSNDSSNNNNYYNNNGSYSGRLHVCVDKLGLLQFRVPELGFGSSHEPCSEISGANSGRSDGDDDAEDHDIDGGAVDAAAREMERLDVAPGVTVGASSGSCGDELSAVIKAEPAVIDGEIFGFRRGRMPEPAIVKSPDGYDHCSSVSGTLPSCSNDVSSTLPCYNTITPFRGGSNDSILSHGFGHLGLKRSSSSLDGMKLQCQEHHLDGAHTILSSLLPSSSSSFPNFKETSNDDAWRFSRTCHGGNSTPLPSSWWVDLDSPESFLDLQDIDDSWVNSLPPLNSYDLININNSSVSINHINYPNYASYYNNYANNNCTSSTPNANYILPNTSVNNSYTTTTSNNSSCSTIDSASNSNCNINNKNISMPITTNNHQNANHLQNNTNIKGQAPPNNIHSHNHNQAPSTTSSSTSSTNNTKTPPRPINSHETCERKRPKRLDLNEPKYVIITRNYESVLKDGFKWRKYGQKSVKNNIYPRSYYKCSYEGCYVHKHVERVALNPCLILTTYRGRHNH